MKSHKISFDRELRRGIAAYEGRVGRWWHRQSANASHRHAYRNIADFVQRSFPKPPGVIVDYACGPGDLLANLQRRLPGSRLIGYDGSSYLLGLARKRLERLHGKLPRRIELIHNPLPDFRIPRRMADLVLFTFPNMVPASRAESARPWKHHLIRGEATVARTLARRSDPDSTRCGGPADIYAGLMRERLVSLNIRQLLKRGGVCLRAEYGNMPRAELTELEQLRTGFEEGSLDITVGRTTLKPWFRIAASRYYQSGVIQDVGHQTGDVCRREGGYFITVLRAC